MAIGSLTSIPTLGTVSSAVLDNYTPEKIKICTLKILKYAGIPLEVCWRGESGEDFPEADRERKLQVSAFRRV